MILPNCVFLVSFPLLLGLLLLLTPGNSIRTWIVRSGAFITAAATVLLLVLSWGSGPQFFPVQSKALDLLMFGVEFFMAAYVVYAAVKARKFLALFLIIAQFLLVAYFEFFFAPGAEAERGFYLDSFSMIMALIIGIIGSLICVYAIGYMKDFHHHYPIKDRRNFFFMILFVFLAAMFGLVFSNNLKYLLFFWETTTICSFVLIGYTKTKEAVTNSFRAISINLAGGIAFSIALYYVFTVYHTIDLDKLLAIKDLALLPVALICFAGLTKSAQMPFSSWLLGAMVAPTPTSALLHSSTMVKAGVFLLLKFSPILQGSVVGNMVALIGGFTFLFSSLANIPEKNGKKLLAYSTVGNLGLIVACAGLGSPEAIWAGMFLVIFHAISKSLVFLVVGTLENRIFSKEIENMDSLIVRMPMLCLLMVMGIAGMCIAPFGVIVSKWAAIEAFLKVNSLVGITLIVLIAYGSGATIFFWAKLMGKVLSVRPSSPADLKLERQISRDEWFSEWSHAVLAVLACLLFPLLARTMVNPYLASVFSAIPGIDNGSYVIVAIMITLMMLIPPVLIFANRRSLVEPGNTYVSGRNFSANYQFESSLGAQTEISTRNYYLDGYFKESLLVTVGNVACGLAIAVMIGAGGL